MAATSFGRYQVLRPLAQGGMGEVFLGRLVGTAGFEKLCVLKTILPQLTADPHFVDRFHHEAQLLVQLNHANIAQVYDMGDVGDRLFMALEHVAGVHLGRLHERCRASGERVPLRLATHIVQKTAEALGYAHRKVGPDGASLGVVHRDVSPQNILVSFEGEVKVIDFGIAKSAVRRHQTEPETVLGKMGYMSPEQARGEPLDPRTDIYSCGVVLYELLRGHSPFSGGSFGELLAAMARPKPLDVDGLDKGLGSILRRALAPEPDKRYQRAEDLAKDLGELLRYYPVVDAVELASFVRSHCGDEVEAHRRLLAGLGSGEASGPGAENGEPHGLEKTSLRGEPTVELSKSRQLVPIDAQAASPQPAAEPPPLRGGPRALGLAALLGLLVAGGVWALRSFPGAGDTPAAPAVRQEPVEARPPASQPAEPSALAAAPPEAPPPTVALAAAGSAPAPESPTPTDSPAAEREEGGKGVAPFGAMAGRPEQAEAPPPEVAPRATPKPQERKPGPSPQRERLAARFRALEQLYQSLVHEVGEERLDPVDRLSYRSVRADFERLGDSPQHWAELSDELADAERRLTRARKLLVK